MKKGFTLIELLAVVIILAVVALIATPIILDVVEDSRISANRSSAYLLIDGAKNYYAESMLNEDKQSKLDGKTNIFGLIEMSGDKPKEGTVYVNKTGQVAVAVVFGDTCFKKNFTESKFNESDDIVNCTFATTSNAYYEFGNVPTTSSPTNYMDVVSSSGGNVFFKLQNEQLSVCINNNTVECFKNNNDEAEIEHMKNVFGEEKCGTDGESYYCTDDKFYCLSKDGYIYCADLVNGPDCDISSDGNVWCSTSGCGINHCTINEN